MEADLLSEAPSTLVQAPRESYSSSSELDSCPGWTVGSSKESSEERSALASPLSLSELLDWNLTALFLLAKGGLVEGDLGV